MSASCVSYPGCKNTCKRTSAANASLLQSRASTARNHGFCASSHYMSRASACVLPFHAHTTAGSTWREGAWTSTWRTSAHCAWSGLRTGNWVFGADTLPGTASAPALRMRTPNGPLTVSQVRVYGWAVAGVEGFAGAQQKVWIAASAHENDKVFVFGGWIENVRGLKSTEMYDFESQQWTELHPMLYKAQTPCICSWKERQSVIVVGGYAAGKPLKNASLFDLRKNTWQSLPATTFCNSMESNSSNKNQHWKYKIRL